eukprot:m.225102 g.225102  ORF g.225102 m.225102 type:complete len:221 (-) comp15953_c0_seq3:712-1374(-)
MIQGTFDAVIDTLHLLVQYHPPLVTDALQSHHLLELLMRAVVLRSAFQLTKNLVEYKGCVQQVPQEALIEIAEECAVQLVDNDNELIAELACHILREIIRSRPQIVAHLGSITELGPALEERWKKSSVISQIHLLTRYIKEGEIVASQLAVQELRRQSATKIQAAWRGAVWRRKWKLAVLGISKFQRLWRQRLGYSLVMLVSFIKRVCRIENRGTNASPI